MPLLLPFVLHLSDCSPGQGAGVMAFPEARKKVLGPSQVLAPGRPSDSKISDIAILIRT